MAPDGGNPDRELLITNDGSSSLVAGGGNPGWEPKLDDVVAVKLSYELCLRLLPPPMAQFQIAPWHSAEEIEALEAVAEAASRIPGSHEPWYLKLSVALARLAEARDRG